MTFTSDVRIFVDHSINILTGKNLKQQTKVALYIYQTIYVDWKKPETRTNKSSFLYLSNYLWFPKIAYLTHWSLFKHGVGMGRFYYKAEQVSQSGTIITKLALTKPF